MEIKAPLQQFHSELTKERADSRGQYVKGQTLMRGGPLEVLVVIPAYNEEKRIQGAMERLALLFQRRGYSLKLIIAEEGSMDHTYTIAKAYENRFPKSVRVNHRKIRIGRGFSVKETWLAEEADIYSYVDCDLPFSDNDILRVVNCVADGYDLATGSRYIEGAKVNRPFLREIVSRIYNLLIRILFRSRINDHQCGLKAASRKFVKYVLPLTREKHWSWDTELLILAQTNGHRVREVPITWVERRHKGTPVRRTLSDLVNQGTWLLKFLVRTPTKRSFYARAPLCTFNTKPTMGALFYFPQLCSLETLMRARASTK